MTNLARILVGSVDAHAERPAIRLDDVFFTFADVEDRTARVAGWLRERGIRPGDRVAIMLPNVPAFPVLYFGALRAGAVVVPMNPLLKRREVEHCLSDSGASCIFAWHASIAEVEAVAKNGRSDLTVVTESSFMGDVAGWPSAPCVAERADDDTAVILYTSGTTGRPKGAELTHANLRTNASVSARLFEMTSDDVIMGCLPLFHCFGQTCGLNTAVAVGASLTLIPRFDAAAALRVVARDHVTVFQGVPTMYIAMLQTGQIADTSTLRMCVSGGASLPTEVLRGFAATFGTHILEGYGLSETSPVSSINRLANSRAGSIGLPIDGVEMRIVDANGTEAPDGEIGEIVIRGHNVMKGYWNRPEATAAAIRRGWFLTGDLARRDGDGFFYIVDRKKDMIIRSGFNVYPREIEEVLYEHPAVMEAAVIGLPHPTYGEEVGAAVVLKAGATATPGQVREFVRERVAAYKYPRLVWFVDDLPKGPTGKILKREITPPGQLP